MPHYSRSKVGTCATLAPPLARARVTLPVAATRVPTAVWLTIRRAPQRSQVAQWLVSLYDAWGKPEQAAEWKEKVK